jgi:starch synthase (maltosyl-transferring)
MAALNDAVRAQVCAGSRTQPAYCAYGIIPNAGYPSWRESAARALSLGFNTLVVWAGTAADPAAELCDQCGEAAAAAHALGLAAMAFISLDRVASTHALAASIAPGCFTPAPPVFSGIADPRRPVLRQGTDVRLRRATCPELAAWWRERLARLRGLGLDGALALDAGRAGIDLAAGLASTDWPVEVCRSGAEAGQIALVRSSEIADDAACRGVLAELALQAGGWVLLQDKQVDRHAPLRSLNRLLRERMRLPAGPLRYWTGPAAPLHIATRAMGEAALIRVTNAGRLACGWPPPDMPPMPWQRLAPVPGLAGDGLVVPPGETLLFEGAAHPVATAPFGITACAAAEPRRRVAITRVSPSVDEGAFATKCIIGESVRVEADLFADGHEKLRAWVLLRAAGQTTWTRHDMAPQGNDMWAATLRPVRLGRHDMKVQAWLDVWGGVLHELRAKFEAGQDVSVDLIEARRLIEAAQRRSEGYGAAALGATLAQLDQDTPDDPAAFLSAPSLLQAMMAADERRFLAESFTQALVVEREAARFSSWYELFPRSQATGAGRHGTFQDVARRLPHIAAMGFDTLYFPPIHPIGVRNRKGRNNAVTAEPDDVGSPYAIGSADGGHDAIHRELGTLDDFRALLTAAAAHGLEIALDFAIQCAPDHPWLVQHPGWFAWRPDGSIKYAENPPKKYQDIVNIDFYAPGAVPGVWHALRDVVLFWAAQGVRCFRVDNPHTKPLPFWQWLIGSVQAAYPDTIFLSEAFTRPKPMYQLAKAGFSQSYTYFTWRNDKAGLTEYLNELAHSGVQQYFRPHFFVNTPDINPFFLQHASRAGFLIRAALAATLSGLWGVYSGFELCESAAVPGREEYLDSEKYELRPRPDRAAGDIVDEIAQLNRLRRREPALQRHDNVAFHNAFNDRIIYYSKSAPGEAARLLVAVSLDPHAIQACDFEVPLWLLGLQDWQSVEVEDLLSQQHFVWTGKMQHMRLTPQHPYAIWRVGQIEAI